MKQKGLTLPELLIALVILALILNLAIPGYSELRQRDQVHTAALDFYQAIQLTRSYAVGNNKRVTMAHTGDHWHSGWEVYEDADNNGQRDDEEPIIWIGDGLVDVQIVANKFVNKYVSFTGSGEARLQSSKSEGAFQAGTFYICHLKQPNMAFQLTLSRGGRMNMRKITETPCQSN